MLQSPQKYLFSIEIEISGTVIVAQSHLNSLTQQSLAVNKQGQSCMKMAINKVQAFTASIEGQKRPISNVSTMIHFSASMWSANNKYRNHNGPFHLLQHTYHFIYQFYSRLIALVQSLFDTTQARLLEMELELNSLD